MTEMFGEAWPPMSIPDLAPDNDDPYFENVLNLGETHYWMTQIS